MPREPTTIGDQGGQEVPVTTSRRLAASDFAFLWEECKRCFWLKAAKGMTRPSMPMPSIFVRIDSAMKGFFMGRRVEEVVPTLPPGVFAHSGRVVESRPYLPARGGPGLFVRGPFDTVLAFDDGTHAVIDFKTSSQKTENVAKYARQLHAYAYALERPAPGAFALPRVERMGLLVYEPAAFEMRLDGRATLAGSVRWIEIRKDEASFLRFLDEVADVLASPEPPTHANGCAWCAFRDKTRGHGY